MQSERTLDLVLGITSNLGQKRPLWLKGQVQERELRLHTRKLANFVRTKRE